MPTIFKSPMPIRIGLILLMGLVLLLPGTAKTPLVDRDEPRFAQATVEMIERGEWVIPFFNGNYRFDKPVLTYWLIRAGYGLLGKNEIGARLHSIISTLILGLVLFWAGRRWFSIRTGFAAAFGLLTCLQFLLNGRSCVADMPMVLAVAVSQICLYEILCGSDSSRSAWWVLIFYLSLGLGFLAKGPIALLVPAIAAALFRFLFWRRPLPWRNLKMHVGIPFLFLIIGSWGIPALLRTQGLFWKIGMNEHVVRRGVEIFNGRMYSPLFYFATAFLSLFPWIAFAGKGWQVLRRRWRSENAFLLAWFAAPYLVFTFYATQLPHYVMPGFAAFFLIMAQSQDMNLDERPWMRWWFWLMIAIPIFVLMTLLFWLLFVHFPVSMTPLRLSLWGCTGIFAGLASLAILIRYRLWIWLWISLLIVAVGFQCLGTGLRRVSPVVQMVPLFDAMSSATRCLAYRYTEGSLVFYSNTRWEMTDDLDRVKHFLEGSGPRLVVFLETEKKLDRYLKWQWNRWRGRLLSLQYEDYTGEIRGLDLSDYAQEEIHGLDLGQFTWITARIIYRF